MLCADGARWLTAAELAAGSGLAPSAAAGVVQVDDADPVRAVARLLAVQAAGGVAVVTDAQRPDEGACALALAAAPGPGGRHRAARPGHLPAGPLLVVLTSGSTRAPRCVLRTVDSWRASHPEFTAAVGLAGDDVVWAPGALTSTLTLFAVHHALAVGLPVVASGRWRGVPGAGHAATTATCVQTVPAVLADVLAARAQGLLPRLRTAVVAGAATSTALRARAAALDLRLVEYYGAAELSFVALDRDGHGLRAFPGVDVAVRDGLVWARSPYLALGYLGAAAGPLRRDDGWASVGDRGQLAADGVLTVTGRGDEAVSVGGATVTMTDVETVLAAVPGVAEVVCVGEPHARLGQRIVAAVRADEGVDPVPALRRAARAGLPQAARPARYVLVAQLPRTSGGKVARAVLREQVTRAGRQAGRRP